MYKKNLVANKMYACIEVLFHDAAEKLVDTRILDCFKFGARNCKELKLSVNATSVYVGISYFDLNAAACIKIKFYSAENELIRYHHMHLNEFEQNWNKFQIPKNSTSVVVCFTTDYNQCENCV